MAGANPYAKLLGAVTFSLVFYGAVTIIFPHILRSGVKELGPIYCTPKSTSGFLLPYTGITSFDTLLCGLASFFAAAFDGDASAKYTTYLGVHLTPIGLLPLIEANRPGRSILLAFPLVVGAMYQRYTAGAIMPLYFLIDILTGTYALTGPQALLPKLAAESIQFALVFGYLLPSGIMKVFPTSPRALAYWQMFPLYITIAQYVYRTLFSSRAVSSGGSTTGTKTIQRLFIFTFVLSAVTHWVSIGPLFGDAEAFISFFIAPLEPRPQSAAIGALNTLQWDGVFFWGSTMLASLWWTRNVTEIALMALWHVFTCLIFGPAAAISGAAFWRESVLQGNAGKTKTN